MEDGIPGDAFGRPPTLRNNPLNRQLSLESVNDKPDKIKKDRPAKTPNFSTKGHSKIKEARAMDIDAKVWTKKIVAEQKKTGEDAKLLLVLFDG